MHSKTCSTENCNNNYYAKKLCRYHYGKNRKSIISETKCKNCKTVYYKPQGKIRSYCSHKCANSFLNKKRSAEVAVNKICVDCKKVYKLRPHEAKKRKNYCSIKCSNNKKQTVTSLKKLVWNNFAIYIKIRDDWTCFTCGKYSKSSNMHAGHFVSRRYNSTLFDEMNVHAQCAGCNMFKNGEPHIYVKKLIDVYGYEKVQKLIEKSQQTKKFKKDELQELNIYYKSKIGV